MMKRSLVTLALGAAVLTGPGVALAQDAPATPGTPGAGQVASCAVEPRSAAELESIRATPVSEATPPETGEATTPIDEETRAAIERTILLAELCAQAGEYDRLAALYSPDAIASGAFDGEIVPIEAGTPVATPDAGEPEPGKLGPPVVRIGWWIDETHVVVEVERGESISQVRMVTIDGQWLIDSGETVVDEMVDDIDGGPEDPATPDMTSVLPIEVLQAIADLLVAGGDGEASTAALTIISAEAVEWPDTFLGCPVEGGFAAQVITPGYRVVVEYGGERYEVHTDLQGHAVMC
jgi:hypothetical protein